MTKCGFIINRGKTDAIFILRQLQKVFLVAGKPFCLAFIDLKKAFDKMPRKVIWWSMRKLEIDEWIVKIVQSMYKKVRSKRESDTRSNPVNLDN